MGLGVPQDFGEAARLLGLAARQGDDHSQHDLGSLYETGRGVEKDPVEAVRWYRAAAEQGHPYGQAKLGLAMLTGHGIDADPVRAFMWLSLAKRSGKVDVADALEIVRETLSVAQQDEAQELTENWKQRRGARSG
jgi:TPR repeat protein